MNSRRPYGLTELQHEEQARFRCFAEAEVRPRAAAADRSATFPRELVRAIAKEGLLGALPGVEGGTGPPVDHVTLGLLNEEMGAACSSARTLLTVHHMVLASVNRFGSAEQKERWIESLRTGDAIGAFALSERNAGSQPDAMTATATVVPGGFHLRATKRWTSFGQYASVFLTFAKLDGRSIALLVPAETPGVNLEPVNNLLGTRGSMVAHVTFDCELPEHALLGPRAFGNHLVSTFALDYGRYGVGWGCVGLLRACFEAAASHASAIPPQGQRLGDHQLVRRLLAESFAGLETARLVCLEAGRLRDAGEPRAFEETFLAKYIASTEAARGASAAVQVHGALGCSAELSVERYYRDAKVMEIIEGSSEIQQIVLGGYALRAPRV